MAELEIEPERSRQRRWELALLTIESARKRRNEWRRVSVFWVAMITIYPTIVRNWPEWQTGLIILGWLVVGTALGRYEVRADRKWDSTWMNAKVMAPSAPMPQGRNDGTRE